MLRLLPGPDRPLPTRSRPRSAPSRRPARAEPLGQPGHTRRRSANEPGFEIRDPLYTVCEGVDLTALPGLGPYGALKLVSEIGLDMRRWATEKHFVSGSRFAPRNQISVLQAPRLADAGRPIVSEDPPHGGHESRAERSCAGRLLPSLGRAYWQSQGDHPPRPASAILVYRMLRDRIPELSRVLCG